MTLIIEDGSIVPNANSFVGQTDYLTYALALGITITGDADRQLVTAGKFINNLEPRLKGHRVERDQAMAFPRSDLWIDGWYWGNNEIPRQVESLQMLLAMDLEAGIDLYNRPEPTNKVVKRERIEGAIEVEYAVSDGGNGRVSARSGATALLNSLTNSNGLFLVRV